MARPGREDELVRGPFIRTVADDPHFGLPGQHIIDDAYQRKLPPTGGCLHRPEPKPTTGTHELLANPEDTVPRAHVPPAQPKNLTTAEAIDQQQHRCRIQRIRPGCS